ncbi:unnamed protein product [Pleuronectes platessa]|uniref:Uncharacterized protein n=1 Tax=Pleuronectes platessa TaxID=8262 RepID=A0A9N7UJP9_PLEPL|nr:unnamed protein product [Pleuronectes platessa]
MRLKVMERRQHEGLRKKKKGEDEREKGGEGPATPHCRTLRSMQQLGGMRRMKICRAGQEDFLLTLCSLCTNIPSTHTLASTSGTTLTPVQSLNLATRQRPDTYLALNRISTSVLSVHPLSGALLPLLPPPSNLLLPHFLLLLLEPPRFSLGRTSSSIQCHFGPVNWHTGARTGLSSPELLVLLLGNIKGLGTALLRQPASLHLHLPLPGLWREEEEEVVWEAESTREFLGNIWVPGQRSKPSRGGNGCPLHCVTTEEQLQELSTVLKPLSSSHRVLMVRTT